MLELLRKVAQLFDRQERGQITLLFVAVFLRAIMETVGVASIMPFMALVASPHLIDSSTKMHLVYTRLHFTSHGSFLIFVGFVVLGVMLVTNALSAYSTWLMLKFVWRKHHVMSRQLLERYLREPYSFYLTRNTADLTKNILGEVTSVMRGLLTPLINVLASATVSLFVFVLLFAFDPKLALIVFVVLGGAYAAVYTNVRGRQGALGRQRVDSNTARFKSAGEAFGAIKDLKVSHRERPFIERFDGPSRVFCETMASNQIMSQVPRYAMESVAFGGILVVVLYLLSNDKQLATVLPMVSLYAFAGYRLMPSLQQVFAGLTEIRFNVPALDDLHDDLARGRRLRKQEAALLAARTSEPLPFERELKLDHVSFTYEGAKGPALRDVSLRIPRNSSIAFVGSTGAGKTTMVDIILGLLRPSQGALVVDGTPVTSDEEIFRWQKRLGYVPQHIYLSDDSLRRNIAFGVSDEEIDEERVVRAASIANLAAFIAELPKGFDTRVGERGVRLSGGQRQRIGIARALYHDPDVLILDEATSALDGITENAVMEAIRSLTSQKTIILIAHRLTTVRDCQTIYLLEHGTITASGTFDGLMASNAVVQNMSRAMGSIEREAPPDEDDPEVDEFASVAE